MSNQTYKNEVSESIHSIATALHKVGAINQAQMKHYNNACLKPIQPLSSDEIREIRENEALTQAAFAIHLNVSKNHISAWERGIRKPSGTALKLLNIIKFKGLDAISY
ncbi:MAG: DNA-binding transcriptional regulator [Neisseriaceae bacterium]|nr:DNA-binding transcriptional regulator [Neisseriaceae bacterium]MBR5941424.1 DNA-binding transcriptional regulator [Neisseriaceae bacterium]